MPLFRVTSAGWTQTALRRLRLNSSSGPTCAQSSYFSRTGPTKIICFIEADPVLLIPRGAVETLIAVQPVALQFIAVDPLFLTPVGHVRNAIAVLSVLTCRSNQVFEVGKY